MLSGTILILTGPVHSGKTTLLRKLLGELEARGHEVDGYLSVAVVQNGTTAGYDLVDSRDKKAFPFLRREGHKDWQRTGAYFFLPGALGSAQEIILSHRDKRFLVIDEVGPLELRGKGVWPAVSRLLSRPQLRCLLVVRKPLLRDLKKLLGKRRVSVFDVEQDDACGALLGKILGRRRGGRARFAALSLGGEGRSR